MDGWNTFSFPFGVAYFQGASQLLVSGSGLFLKTKVEEFQVILENFHVGGVSFSSWWFQMSF